MSNDVRNLTVFWAMSECLLGGIMHALKIPFTGISVGSIAVICIGLISIYSTGNKGTLLKALGLVLSVKLLASPHSPWQAYVAVSFQGLAGALLLCHNKTPGKLSILIFAVLALMESALQKALILFFIYGSDFFHAIDQLILQVTKGLGIGEEFSASLFVLYFYLFIHLIMGLIVGKWIPKIPLEINAFKEKIPMELLLKTTTNTTTAQKAKNINSKKIIKILLLIAMPIMVYLILPSTGQGLLVNLIVRVLMVSVFIFYVIGPIIRFLFIRFLQPDVDKNPELITIIEKIPQWRYYIQNSIIWVKDNYTGPNRLKYLFLTLLAISLEGNDY